LKGRGDRKHPTQKESGKERGKTQKGFGDIKWGKVGKGSLLKRRCRGVEKKGAVLGEKGSGPRLLRMLHRGHLGGLGKKEKRGGVIHKVVAGQEPTKGGQNG